MTKLNDFLKLPFLTSAEQGMVPFKGVLATGNDLSDFGTGGV